MLVVKCKSCGKEFPISQRSLELLELKNIPERCPACLDRKQGSEKAVLERCLSKWYVWVENIKFLKLEKKGKKYDVYGFGGSFFGIWGGDHYSQKYLFYVYNKLTFPGFVQLKEMRKTIISPRGERSHVYFVIEPTKEEGERLYLYLMKEWYIANRGGPGRRYEEYLAHPYGKPLQENEVKIICTVSSYNSSGLFGNTYRLVATSFPSQVVGCRYLNY